MGLLTGVLLAGVAPASVADPERRVDAISARLVPPLVTEGEPAMIVGTVTPPGEVDLVVKRLTGGGSTYEVRSDAQGRFQAVLDTSSPSLTKYEVSTTDNTTSSVPVWLEVTANTACSANPPPVDTDKGTGGATGEVHCLLQRLDRWQDFGLMGVGQQLNISALTEDAFEPLDELDDPVAVVGFDLEELDKTANYTFPFLDEQIDRLLTLSDQGVVLTASWHATNPGTGGDYKDRSWRNLAALLKPGTAAAQAFWADYDAKLDLLRRFQDGDGGQHRRTAVVFRPLHEANGGFFWWGKPDPKVYKDLWAEMQDRAAAAGVHNIVWAYAANRWTDGVRDPRTLVPRRVDLGGLDSYDPEKGAANSKDRLWLEGYRALQGVARVPRMALTEVGPHGSRLGDWRPAVVTNTVRREGLRPAWAMLWFDDGNGRDGVTGLKQIGSLDGGRTWLRSCPNGLCTVG